MSGYIVYLKRRKQAFLLLEMVLSLSLLAMLLGTVAFLQKDLLFSRRHQNAVYKAFVDEQHAYVVLRSVFNSAKQVKCYAPASCSQLASCIFDRGICRDPELSGCVRGEIYFSQENQTLELIVHSLRAFEKSEKILVLDHVKNVHMVETSLDRLEVRILREVPGVSSHSLMYLFRLVV